MKNISFSILFVLITISVLGQDLDSVFKTVKYRNIGPFTGGRSVSVSGVENDPLAYYMGTTGGGLWKTEDAGLQWSNISDGFFKTGSVGAVATSKSNPNIVYCGMGEHAPRGVMTSYGDGMYRSNDAGKTWVKIGLEKTQHIARIVIHPENPDIVFVAAQGALYGPNEERGIFKSIDGGKSWNKILFINELTGCSELSMDMNNPLVLYAAMWERQRKPWQVISGGEGSGLYKTSDGGETWKKINEGLPKGLGKLAVSVCQSNPNKVYALVEGDSEKGKGGLFVSINAGEKWTKINGDRSLIQRAWYYIEVFANPQNENEVYVLSASCYKSIDGGKTFKTISGTHGDYHDLWINSNNPKNIIIANDGGAAISFNEGKSWSKQNNMPTGQFYRVNVDNDFPYRLYGGQQDQHPSKVLANRYEGQQIIGGSAGSESAFLAFDPDNPRYAMGGSYGGTIDILDNKAKTFTQIMAAPIQNLGEDPVNMKYRFNWNLPIIWSAHEPDTYYQGGQVLLKSTDLGITWKEVSPDLTRNEKEKQGKGGIPFTNEAVGAENYGTISYISESAHEKGFIWTGSDDGLVYLTKDGGNNWLNVTPKGLEECLINAIEVSPHDPATAYIATTRYKFNDHTPGLYKTTNYGKSWMKIDQGIPTGAYTRVVREDEVRKDLLYAGTELGMYISWNGGQNWSPFQLNLPIVPINDIMCKHGDLQIATSGRAFWILDDLGLIRQYEEEKSSEIFTIYKPEDGMLGTWYSQLDNTSKEFKGTNPFSGVNPAQGVVIYYQLPKLADSTHVTLEIKNSDGVLVNTFSSKKIVNPKFHSPKLSKEKGINRFVWNMRYRNLNTIPNVRLEGGKGGHIASPGNYTLTIKVDTKKHETECNILANPTYEITSEEYEKFHIYMSQMESVYNTILENVNDLNKMKNQLKNVIKELDAEKHSELLIIGDSLVKRIQNWDEEIVQRKTKVYDDVENFPNKFTAQYLFLLNQTQSPLPRITNSSRERRIELDTQWNAFEKRFKEIVAVDIPAFNKMLWEAGFGIVRK